MLDQERSLKTEAVVLRHSDWGETDRLLTFYTRERGKLRAIAKGVRKLHSRKAGHLEPFMRTQLMLARGRDFWLVTQADAQAYFIELTEDLMRTAYAAYLSELVDRFTIEDEPNHHLYGLYTESLQRLAKEEDPYLALHYAEMHMLDLFGFRPELFYCVKCSRPIQAEDQFFSADLGGVVCPACEAGQSGLRPVKMETLKYLRHLQRSNWPQARKAQIEKGIRQSLDALMQHYITYVLERSLNTPDFLRQIRKNSAAE